MELAALRGISAAEPMHDGLLIPAKTGNGWAVVVADHDGKLIPVTDHGGHEKVYHSLDGATSILKELGVAEIQVIEHF